MKGAARPGIGNHAVETLPTFHATAKPLHVEADVARQPLEVRFEQLSLVGEKRFSHFTEVVLRSRTLGCFGGPASTGVDRLRDGVIA